MNTLWLLLLISSISTRVNGWGCTNKEGWKTANNEDSKNGCRCKAEDNNDLLCVDSKYCINTICSVNPKPCSERPGILTAQEKCQCGNKRCSSTNSICHVTKSKCVSKCPAGTYKDRNSQICNECETGKYQPLELFEGETCLFCAAGFSFVSTTQDCAPCAGEHYQKDNNRASVTCSQWSTCNAGKYASTSAPSATKDRECSSCSDNHYQDLKNQASCTACTSCRTDPLIKDKYTHGCTKTGSSPGVCKDCATCGTGKYLDGCSSAYGNDQGKCVDCEIGQYQNQPQQNDCKKHPDFRATEGKMITDCPKSASTGVCTRADCDVGTYNSGNDMEIIMTCKKCEKGTFSSTKGKKVCDVCPNGQYQDKKGQKSCKPHSTCPDGTSCKYLPDEDTVSTICVAGTYAKKGGTCVHFSVEGIGTLTPNRRRLDGSAVPPPSSLSSSSRDVSWENADINIDCNKEIKDKTNIDDADTSKKIMYIGHCLCKVNGKIEKRNILSSKPKTDPSEESFDDRSGSTFKCSEVCEPKCSNCELCSNGEFYSQCLPDSDGKDCKLCPAGQFLSESNPHQKETCSKCPLGKSTNGFEGAPSCEECEEGQYSDAETKEGKCWNCPTGYVSTFSAASATKFYELCKAIDQQKYRPNPSRERTEYCTPGHFCDGMNILPCPPGRSALSKQDNGCVACDRGKFSTKHGAISCTDCAPATYAEGRGTIECSRCPADTFRTTSGATSSSDCSSCSAKIGNNMVTLDREFGSDTANDCVCKERYLDVGKYDKKNNVRDVQSRCIDCPNGADCTSPGAALTAVNALPNYWRADWKSHEFFPCLKEFQDCIGGGIITNITLQNQNHTNTTNSTQQAMEVEKSRQAKEMAKMAAAAARLEEAKQLLRKNKGAVRIRLRSTSGQISNYWCLDQLSLYTDGAPPKDLEDHGVSIIDGTNANITSSTTRNSATALPTNAFHGNRDAEIGVFCTRKYYSDLEGALPNGVTTYSSSGYLAVKFNPTPVGNSSRPMVITHYRVCTGKRSFKATTRSWVLEVSGTDASISYSNIRGNFTAQQLAASNDLPWVPVSVVSRKETEELSVRTENLKDSTMVCKVFTTNMADILSASSPSSRRALQEHSDISINAITTLTTNTQNSTKTSNATQRQVLAVRWERDLQCRYGNTGPLCANCYDNWARSLNPLVGCIDCSLNEAANSSNSASRRLGRTLVDVTYPLYTSVVRSSAVQSYIQYHHRRALLSVNNENNNATSACLSLNNNSTQFNATNNNQTSSLCDYSVGDVLSGKRSSWEVLAPTIGLAFGTFVFGFIFALIGMALPADTEDKAPGMGPMDQIRNQTKIIVGFTQIFSNMEQIFKVTWPPVFATFMETFSFINLDVASMLGGAIDPCAFNMPFLYGFAVHMCMLPGFLFALFMAYYLRGYAMLLFQMFTKCPCCKWKICSRCHRFFSSGAGKNTAILRMAKADLENANQTLENATKLYTTMISKFESNLETNKEEQKINKSNAVKMNSEEDDQKLKEEKENLNKKQEALLMSLSDAKKQQTTDLAALNVELKEAESSLKDAMKLKENIKRETKGAKDRLVKWTNMFIFFIFPGITMKSFLALRCRQILDTEYLSKDLTQECWKGDHMEWGVWLAGVSILLYAIGVPFMTWYSLYRHRKGMFDSTHPDYYQINRRFGNLFQQYEPKFWYWEVIEMIRKLLLTGGLVLAADGTSAQFLIAQVISLLYLVLVIRKLPYEADTDDILSTLASLSLLFTLMAGFAIKSEEDAGINNMDSQAMYNKNIMGIFLCCINGFVFLFAMGSLGAIIGPACKDCKKNIQARRLKKAKERENQAALEKKYKNRRTPSNKLKTKTNNKGKNGTKNKKMKPKSKSKVKPISPRTSNSKTPQKPIKKNNSTLNNKTARGRSASKPKAGGSGRVKSASKSKAGRGGRGGSRGGRNGSSRR